MINKTNFLGTVNNYSNNDYKNYILVKDSNFKIVESPKITITEEDNIKIANEQFTQNISHFVETLEKESLFINLSVFFENLKTLTIEEKGFMLFKKISPGSYDIAKNKITLRKKNNMNSIYHELLHCSSSKKTKETLFSGFFQSNENGSIARGINEGYTSLLEVRFFNKSDSYNINRIIAGALEEIVGTEKMYKFYFNADLLGLINELKKYMEEEKILSFLIELDNFTEFSLRKKPFNKHDEKIKNIVNFLLECYCNKIFNLFKNNLITHNDLYNLIDKFIGLLDYECKVNKWEFELLSQEQINEMVIPYFNKIENQKNKAI